MLKKFFHLPRIFGSLAAMTLVFFNSIVLAEPLSGSQIVEQNITKFMQQYHIPGVAVALVDKGKVTMHVFGLADQVKNKPVTADTIFEIGSITKLFTTLLLAEAVNDQQVKLDDKLTQYFPALAKNPDLNKITLLELATYSSSLPFTLPDSVQTDEQLQDYLLHWKPEYPIGTATRYSNLSIGLLGRALEQKSGQSLTTLYQNGIFDPLKMTTTAITLTPKQARKLAQGYTEIGSAAKHTGEWLLPAAGAGKASLRDLTGFLIAAVGLPSTPAKIRSAMQVAQTPRAQVGDLQQALAWRVTALDNKDLLHPAEVMNMDAESIKWLPLNKQVYNANSLIDKTGATSGFRAYIAVIPGQQSGVVVLTNRYVSNGAIITVGRTILSDVVGK